MQIEFECNQQLFQQSLTLESLSWTFRLQRPTNYYQQLSNTKYKHFLMRGLYSTKAISSTADKKSSTRIVRQLPSLTNIQLNFQKIQILIVPTQYLPIVMELQDKEISEIELQLTHQSAIARQRKQNVTIPLNIHKQRWVKMTFGVDCKKIAIRSINNNKRIDRNQLYTDCQIWKQEQKQQSHNCYHISVQSIILLLKVKGDKQQRRSQIGYKNSISSFIKTKFSQRGNLKPNNIVIKRNDVSIKDEGQRKQTSGISRSKKHDSQTLQLQNLEEERFKDRRQSNPSTSIRLEPRDIKFSRRIKKLRELADSKNSYSQKDTEVDDQGDFFSHTKIKPRFYQHINISQQQIDLKRKKFDSQFINKKSAFPSTSIDIPDKQVNESQVTEDICKMQGSKSIHPIEDTFQRGMRMQRNNGLNTQQSGTLCQSVYQ